MCGGEARELKGGRGKEVKKEQKISTAYGDEQIDDGVGGQLVEAEVSSRGRGVPEDGPKKEIGICRLPLSGENWIRSDRF